MYVKSKGESSMFSYQHPVKIHFGQGIFSELEHVLAPYNFSSFVIVMSNSQIDNGLDRLVASQLGEDVKDVVTGITPNPTLEDVRRIVSVMEEHEADCLIAIGGGSVMDAAKAAGAVYLQSIDINHLLEHTDFSESLPVIAIPTTSGSGSEVTPTSVISDGANSLKVPLIGEGLYSEAAVVDPELTLTLPAAVTAVSGIDVICHALDCLGSAGHNAISDALAVSAAKLAFDNLERAYHEPMNTGVRENMSAASLMAGVAVSQTGTSGSHAMSYHLTSHYDVPHGEACALTAGDWYIVNARANPKLDDHARMIGFDDARDLKRGLDELKLATGLAMKFSDLGIASEEMKTIVERAFEYGDMKNNIAQPDQAEVLKFLSEK